MTVQEVMRAFGVPAQSALWKALVKEGLLTAPQAVSCLGRSVHVSVARQVVATLIQNGETVSPPLRDGSNTGPHTDGGGDPRMAEKWCLYVTNTLYTSYEHP